MVHPRPPLIAIMVSLFVGWFLFDALLVLAVEHGVTSHHLRVSIRNNHLLQESPSCQHSIGQVELLNLHPSDHIRIHSIRTTAERTEVVFPSSDDVLIVGEGDYTSGSSSPSPTSSCLQLPFQLHAVVADSHDTESSVSDSIVTLGPGQIVMVPVALLPRFPPPPLSWFPQMPEPPKINGSIVEEAPRLSIFQIADWNDMMENDCGSCGKAKHGSTQNRRNNYYRHDMKDDSVPERYLISTTVLVETDHGVIELPLEVSTVRKNEYGLPDTIYFDAGYGGATSTPSDESDEQRIREALRLIQQAKERENNRRRTIPSQADVYLVDSQTRRSRQSNSSKSSAHDEEQPDGPSDCFDLYIDATGSSSFQISQVSISRPDRITLHTLDEGESLSDPPRSLIDYWPSPSPEAKNDQLFIPADEKRHYVVTVCCCTKPLQSSEAPSLRGDDIPDWMDADENESGDEGSTSLGILQIKTSRGPLYVALEEARGEILDHLRYPPSTAVRSPPVATTTEQSPLSHLQAHPNAINITFYATSLPSATIPINVTTNNNSPFTLMRGTVVLDTDVSNSVDVRLLGLQTNALRLECTWSQVTDTTVTIHGAIIIRATGSRLSYSKWKDSLERASVEVLEIPLTINVVPEGRISFVVDGEPQVGAFFPTHAALDATIDSSGAETLVVDRLFQVVASNAHLPDNSTTMMLQRAFILPESGAANPALCGRFKLALKESTRRGDVGAVIVRYGLPKESSYNTDGLPTVCYLRVFTQPDAGVHQLQFMVYSGQVSISSEETWPHSRKEKQRSTAGMSSLVDWFRNTKAGFSLRSVIKTSNGPDSADRDAAALKRYLLSLVGKISRDDWTRAVIQPVLLNAGTISQGEKEVIPIYVTNNNPFPVTISIDVGEVEGMSIELGRDEMGSADHLLDFLPLKKSDARASLGRFQGHPIHALKRFLLESDQAKEFFRKLPYRDSVNPNFPMLKRFPLLELQYRKHGTSRNRKNRIPFRFTQYGWNECDHVSHPPPYGAFQRKLEQGIRKLPGPIIISSDQRTLRQLKKCWYVRGEPKHLKTDESSVVLPPGSVARFDVKLLAPSSSALEKDITQFVSTGLALSTDIGETIPIVLAFGVLQGNLEVSHIPSAPQHSTEQPASTEIYGAIQVPAGLFGSMSQNTTSSIRIPPNTRQSVFTSGLSIVPRNASTAETGVALFMKSSFFREIHLRQVISCNPWFEVSLVKYTDDSKVDPFLGVHIGAVSNIVSCKPIEGLPENSTIFPSFYRCALSWVTQRLAQPKGCGSVRDNQHIYKDNASNGGETGRKFQNLIGALQRAILVSEWTDSLASEVSGSNYHISGPSKSGRRAIGGLVSPLLLDTMSTVWTEIRRASDFGLLELETNLHAIVEYKSTPEELSLVPANTTGGEESSHLLSLAIRNISVASVLETPTLLGPSPANTKDGVHQNTPVIDFPPTGVAEVSSLLIPVRNPTAVPVRVRLAVAKPFSAEKECANDEACFDPPYIHGQKHERMGPLEYANLQWWERAGAYVAEDRTGDVIRSHYNITIKSGAGATISLVNPSYLASTAFIVGCGNRCGLRSDGQTTPKVDAVLVDLKPRSPIGASAGAGHVLVGRPWPGGHAESPFNSDRDIMDAGGNLVSGLRGPSPFAIPFPSFDEVVIPPFSEAFLGPILFRPPGRAKRLGCAALRGQRKQEHCESQMFETSLYLENSLSGLELVSLRGKALWESVVILDSTREGPGDIEVKNGRETLVFPGFSSTNSPIVKEFLLYNNGDIAVVVEKPLLGDLSNSQAQQLDDGGNCETDSFRVLGCHTQFPFMLEPGQNQTLKVAHFPHCTKQKEQISMRLLLQKPPENLNSQPISVHERLRDTSNAGPLRKKYTSLVLGYDMDDQAFSSCKIARSSQWVEENGELGFENSTTRVLRKKKLHKTTVQRGSVFVVAATGAIGVAIMLLNKRLRWTQQLCIQFSPQWQVHFLCLAKLDPSTSELRNIGRERSRDIMQASFNRLNLTPPQSIRRSALLGRDGSGGSSHEGAAGIKKRRGIGSDRVRASEGIFGNYQAGATVGGGKLPLQLGWRVAASRGIITPSSFDAMSLELKTRQLLVSRENEPPNQEKRNSHVEIKASSLEGESMASSYDELTDDEDIPNSVSRSVSPPGETAINGAPPNGITALGPSSKRTAVALSEAGWTDARAKGKTNSRAEGKPETLSARKSSNSSRGLSSASKAAAMRQRSPSPAQIKNKDNHGGSNRTPTRSLRKVNQQSNAWAESKDITEAGKQSFFSTDIPSPSVIGETAPTTPRRTQQIAERSTSNAWKVDSPTLRPISTPPTPSRSVIDPDTPPPPSPPHQPDDTSSPRSHRVPTPINLRPPPGLGPPPGFGSDTPFLTPPATELPTLDTISTKDMLLSGPAFMGTSLQSNLFENPSPLLTSSVAVQEEPMEEFDILDFLDDILHEDETTSPIIVPSNPWATTESRAAAYGIPIDWEAKNGFDDGENSTTQKY